MENKTLLVGEINSELGKLKGLEIGSDKYKTTIDGLTKLYDRSIELEKLEVDREEKRLDREEKRLDREEKRKAAEEERVDRWVRHGLTAAGIIIPSVITIWGTIKSIKFEQEGTITTIMGRGFINKLLPKK